MIPDHFTCAVALWTVICLVLFLSIYGSVLCRVIKCYTLARIDQFAASRVDPRPPHDFRYPDYMK